MTKHPQEMIASPTEFYLEKESFLASGIPDNELLLNYRHKLNDLYHQFIHSVVPPPDSLAKAEALFKWLWTEKPARYKPYGCFRLNDVIDAQLSKDSQPVGNCLGLTLLYNCLLKKIGIDAGAHYLENGFGIGPHVLTVLKREASLTDIENSLPDGFDYKGHLDDPSRIEWGDRELVADIYHSLGNELFLKGEWSRTLEKYEMSLHLNSGYEKARLNKVILLDKMEMDRRTG
jgi:hypothetical protein